MSSGLVIRPEAEDDLSVAYDWYEGHTPGLGSEFLDGVELVMEIIADRPTLYPLVHGPVRRALVRRFPYEVFYTVSDQEISALAVMHTRRDPLDWQGRV